MCTCVRFWFLAVELNWSDALGAYIYWTMDGWMEYILHDARWDTRGFGYRGRRRVVHGLVRMGVGGWMDSVMSVVHVTHVYRFWQGGEAY